MYSIGIDVGSTYTKYCVMLDSQIVNLFSEKTPIRQENYFVEKIAILSSQFPDCVFSSCGYGKANVNAMQEVNELVALAKGVQFSGERFKYILDIGGQDTKLIKHQEGKLEKFFLNDKCAAGSGMFLVNSLNLLDMTYDDIVLDSMMLGSKPPHPFCVIVDKAA